MVRYKRRKQPPAAEKAGGDQNWIEVEATVSSATPTKPTPTFSPAIAETTTTSTTVVGPTKGTLSRSDIIARTLAADDDDDEDNGANVDDDDDDDEEEEEGMYLRRTTKTTADSRFQMSSDEEDEADDDDEQGEDGNGSNAAAGSADDDDKEGTGVEDEGEPEIGSSIEGSSQPPAKRVRGPKPLTAAALLKHEQKVARTGVVYLSRIPPFMRPTKLRSLLSKYGKLGRIYLAPESAAVAARRKKYRNNKRENYTEGWVEFEDKSVARAVAGHLNGNPIGGKKRNFYYDDLWNLKYLPRFKWNHLTEQIAYELKVRDQKLKTEMNAAKKETKEYVKNVGRAKMVQAIEERKLEKKRKAVEDAGGDTPATSHQPSTEDATKAIRRQFKQRKVVDSESVATNSHSRPASSGKKAAVLAKLFG
ncbi:hypothetical protein PhCBS80983_g03238 [Powellomyces hirtus]|uniref:18S rRNA factor 2 n=1 Tax=Powellomyces hirtus TaxID=109895 RepID=A0A507E379_9FUNG|nr:hypothetical protein PhCBS80983_g03238 [Powellomyces hirtus]